jgi:hypothetical protein
MDISTAFSPFTVPFAAFYAPFEATSMFSVTDVMLGLISSVVLAMLNRFNRSCVRLVLLWFVALAALVVAAPI